jgi:hypothetical protein
VLVLGWNVVRVNTVLFQQTKREVEQSTA